MMKNPFEGKEVWFLTGSQGLYGQETLDQVKVQSQSIAKGLDEAEDIPASIVWKPVLTDSDSILETIREANNAENVIGVIAWMHTFSPARMWIRGLDALQVPLLHLHTQIDLKLPWSTIDMDFMNLNQAAHGDREFGYILTRMGVPRVSVVGHVTDPKVLHRVGTWTRAAAGWHEIQHMKMVRFGDNMRNVAVTEGDKTEAAIKFGVAVNTWSVNELAEAVEAVPEETVDALVAEYADLYDCDPALLPGGKRHDSLRYAAREEAAIRGFLEENDATALTDTFEDLGALKQLPGLAVQRLMADGYGFGAEGDWKTGVLIRVAKVMGYGLPGGASLMEDYSYNLEEGNKKILGAHMLEICPSLTQKKPSLEIHPLSIGDREDPVRLVFNADPSDGIVVAMSDLRDRFRLTANVVKVTDPDEPMPNLPVASAVWEPAPDFETSATCWLAAGAAHHTVLSTALELDTWRDFAKIAGVELAVVDEDTTVRNFEDSLAWNAVYHRVSTGI